MRVFCDTNVLVAAFLATHPHHSAARPILERVLQGTDQGFLAAHSLAETYAVLTRLPGSNRVPAGLAWQLIHENLIRHFSIVSLGPRDYSKALQHGAANGTEGGRIYDALLLAAAGKTRAERIYTFNVAHFQEVATEPLRGKIAAP